MSKILYLEDMDYLEYCVDFYNKTDIDLLGNGKTRLENQDMYEKIIKTYSYQAFLYHKSKKDLFDEVVKHSNINEAIDWLNDFLANILNKLKIK
jgi:hypothetical protein